ncbi:MAG: hypothetical protein WC536_04260 [Patescibacteria group bacterium]
MKANWKSLLFLITFIVVAALFATFFLSKEQDKKDINTGIIKTSEGDVAGSTTIQGEDYTERLARFLNEKGMVLYGSYQSKGSLDQKELFKASSQYLDYVECDASGLNANPDECLALEISIYPTWIYEGKQYAGERTLAELAGIVGFSE